MGFLGGRLTAPEPEPRLVRFTLQPPDSVTTYARCCGNELALSPDGSTLVFVGNHAGATGLMGPLYRRTLGQLHAEPIPGTHGGSVPFFSPDGRWVGFFLEGRIRKVSLAGGPPLPVVAANNVSEASWGDGDVIVFSERGRLRMVPAAGGASRDVTSPDSGSVHYAPSFLPGGKAVLFTLRGLGAGVDATLIGVADLGSGRVDTIGAGTRALYANGYLVYAGGDNTLLAQPFDPRTRKTTGPAAAILDRIALHGSTTHEFALSSSALAYEPSGLSTELLRLITPSGNTTIALPNQGVTNLEDPAFSRDGGRIALRLSTAGNANQDLWILDRRQGTLERLTVGGGGAPTWSRDGRSIAYAKGSGGLYRKAADGTGDEELVLAGTGLTPGSWLPGDRALVFQAAGRPNTRVDIGVITLGDSTPRWLVATEFRERQPQVSPDGRWLAYNSDRSGRFEIYVQPMAGDGPRVQISTEGGEAPRWDPRGRMLYYVAGGTRLMAASVTTLPSIQVTGRRVVSESLPMDLNAFNVAWDIHPNGRDYIYVDETGDIGARNLVWILDWIELVRAMGGVASR